MGTDPEHKEIYAADPNFSTAGWHEIFITTMRHPADAERVRRIRRLFQRHVARHPGGVAGLTLMERTSFSHIDPGARAETEALVKDTANSLGAALVIEGSGFRAATARTMLAGVYLLSKHTYPRKVLDNVGDGARWLLSVLRPGKQTDGDALDLERFIEHSRSQMGPVIDGTPP